jgi:hypothetical protein
MIGNLPSIPQSDLRYRPEPPPARPPDTEPGAAPEPSSGVGSQESAEFVWNNLWGARTLRDLLFDDQGDSESPTPVEQAERQIPLWVIESIYHDIEKRADGNPSEHVELRKDHDKENPRIEIIKRFDHDLPGNYTLLDQATLTMTKDELSLRFEGVGPEKFRSLQQVRNKGEEPDTIDPESISDEKKGSLETYRHSMEIVYKKDGTGEIRLTASSYRGDARRDSSEVTVQMMPEQDLTQSVFHMWTPGRDITIPTTDPDMVRTDLNRLWNTEFDYIIEFEDSLRSFIQHFAEYDYFPHPDMVMFTERNGIPQLLYRQSEYP